MVTKELLDYIEGQLTVGVSREKIISGLTSEGGWNMNNIQEAFATLEITTSSTSGVPTTKNKYWSKIIPSSNSTFMVISLGLFLGLDLMILVTNPGMYPFWAAMLVVIVIFAAFYYYENYKLAKKFKKTKSKADVWILVLVTIRNVVFVLNFIPFIQILGAGILILGGIPYIILYYIALMARSKFISSTAGV